MCDRAHDIIDIHESTIEHCGTVMWIAIACFEITLTLFYGLIHYMDLCKCLFMVHMWLYIEANLVIQIQAVIGRVL